MRVDKHNQRPKLPLRLINKQANEEVRNARGPLVVAVFCTSLCLTRWLYGPKKGRYRKLKMIGAVVVYETNDFVLQGRPRTWFDSRAIRAEEDFIRRESAAKCVLALGDYSRRPILVSAAWNISVKEFQVKLCLWFEVGDVIG